MNWIGSDRIGSNENLLTSDLGSTSKDRRDEKEIETEGSLKFYFSKYSMPNFVRAFLTNCNRRGFSRSVVQPDSLYSQKRSK